MAKDDEGQGSATADRACTQRIGQFQVIEIKFRRLAHAAGLPPPSYQSNLAAGLDLVAAVAENSPISLAPGERALIPTGFCVELPEGFEGQVRPRSGLALKNGVTV